MVSNTIYNYIVAEFSKKESWSSANFNSIPSIDDVNLIISAIKNWAKQNNKLLDESTLDIRELF